MSPDLLGGDPSAREAATRPPRALLVDDRRDNLLALQAVLEPLGIAMTTAASGEEALRLLLNEDFSLIVLDVYKPFEPAILRAKVAALIELGGVRERLEMEVAERTTSARRLAERERQLAEAESLAQVGAWRWDIATGHVTWSDELFRIFGLVPQSVLPTFDTYLSMVHDDDRPTVEEAIRRAQHSGRPFHLEHRAVRVDGSLAWIRCQGRRSGGDEGLATMYGAAQDITERTQAALLLAESEARYRALVEHAPEAIVVVDLDTGRFVDANPEAERLFGVVRDELYRMQAEPAWIQRALSGEADPFEWLVHSVTGHPVLCEVRLLPLPGSGRALARGSLLDITERRRVEEAAAALAEQERAIRQTRQIAQTLQRSLLPDRLPDIPGIGFASRYLPGSAGLEVGGDWYDVVPMPSGTIALAIGDVVGHGLRAAATMGQLRTALRAYALEDSSPQRVIQRLGDLTSGLPEAEMTTLVYAVYQPDAGVLRYMCAGHPPPLLIQPDGVVSYLEEGRVTPLGMRPGSAAEGVVALDSGSVLIFYTDGLVERPGMDLGQGMDRLAQAARAVTDRQPEAICKAITAAMEVDDGSRDDVALLVVALSHWPSSQFRLPLPADPRHLGSLRRGLNRWLSHVGATVTERQDIVLAVSEAATNSMMHAYAGSDGMVEVEGSADGDLTTVTVRDTGTWRPGQTSEGGRGIPLMQALVDSCDVVAGPTGTEVVLRRCLGRPLQASTTSHVEVSPDVAARAVPSDEDAIVVVPLLDDVDASNAEVIASAVAQSIRETHWGLILDLTDLRYIDSSGIRMLMDLKRRLDRRRKELCVVVPDTSSVQRVLEVTQVAGLLQRASGVQEAVAAMRTRMERSRALSLSPGEVLTLGPV
ncbi:MAG: hypothetical protein NVSMB32_13430 [Actinomycetota bacterium]